MPVPEKRSVQGASQMCQPIAVAGQPRRQKDAEAKGALLNKFLGLN